MADCLHCHGPLGRWGKKYCSYGCANAARLAAWETAFWAKVDKGEAAQGHGPSRCWLWTGSRDPKGYGRLGRTINGKLKPLRATRVSLEIALGRPLAPGMQACHRCDNPPCVRPDHLFEGTNTENQKDSAAKGRARYVRVVGERHGQSKLTEEQVREIRRRYADGGRNGSRTARGGITMRELAADYGVNIARISEIVSGKAWSHVGGADASA